MRSFIIAFLAFTLALVSCKSPEPISEPDNPVLGSWWQSEVEVHLDGSPHSISQWQQDSTVVYSFIGDNSLQVGYYGNFVKFGSYEITQDSIYLNIEDNLYRFKILELRENDLVYESEEGFIRRTYYLKRVN